MGVPPAEDMGINPLECPVGGKPMSEQKDRPDREKTAKIIEDLGYDKYGCADEILALIEPLIEEAKKQEGWVDIPSKAGEYWLSAFCEGKYIHPRILSVIDYQRTDRGLEVQYNFPHNTISVKTFCEEYYPNAKWMFIAEPNWQALKEER